MKKTTNTKNGFSLVEIMVSMVIAGLVMAGIYGVYTIQQRTYTVQEQVSEMQQKGRAAVDYMARDIRMAGYDEPDGSCASGDVSTATPAAFAFETCDAAGNQIIVNYGLYDAYISSGENNDIQDDLFRRVDIGTTLGNRQLIAEGVNAIEFLYSVEDATTPGTFNSATTVAAADLPRIRSVQISMLIRASYPDPRYTDTILHQPASAIGVASPPVWDINGSDVTGTGNPANDGYHRRLLITTVKMRNMGLQ